MRKTDIDIILYIQLIIARLGEKEIMNWWNTDIAYEMGGADFLERLLGKTIAPLAAGEGILKAGYLKDIQMLHEMPNNNSVFTLFKPDPEIADGIEGRLRHFKRYPDSLPENIAKILDPKKDWSASELADLVNKSVAFEHTGTSFGNEIKIHLGYAPVDTMTSLASLIITNEKGRYTLAYYRKG